MATLKITGPDGRVVRITPPAGATQQQIDAEISQIMAGWGASAPQPTQAKPVEQQASAGEMAADVIKSAGIGLAQGAIGLGTLPGNIEGLGRAGINYAADLLGSGPVVDADTALINYNDLKERIESRTGEFYKPQTTAGEYARTIGEFAPAAIGGGASLGAKAAQVIAPALASETAGQLTEGTAAEPWARVAGALAGTRLPNVGARVVTPAPVDPQRAAAVQALQRQGVTELTAGQKTGAVPVRWAEAATASVPGGGGKAAAMQQKAAEQFTRSALSKAGINATRADPDTLARAFDNIGNEFRTFGQGVNVQGSKTFGLRLQQIADNYAKVTPESMRVPLVQQVAQEVAQRAMTPGGIPGREYAGIRSALRRAQRGLRQDPQSSDAVGRLVEALDAQMVRSAPKGQGPKMAQQLKDLNTRYKNMLAIEDAALGSGEQAAVGLLSPAQLKNAVKKQNKRDYTRGRGDLAELARAGEAVLKPLPSSGTSERLLAQSALTAPAIAAGGVMSGGMGVLAGSVAPWASQAVMSRVLMSKPVQRYLANQKLPQTLDPVSVQKLAPIIPFILQKEEGTGTIPDAQLDRMIKNALGG